LKSSLKDEHSKDQELDLDCYCCSSPLLNHRIEEKLRRRKKNSDEKQSNQNATKRELKKDEGEK
jgi:hypothetical protein